jgi:hypothetical protein
MILSHILWMMGTSHHNTTSSHLDDIITYTMDDGYYPLVIIQLLGDLQFLYCHSFSKYADVFFRPSVFDIPRFIC